MYHRFFLHSSIGGLSGYFRILAIVNNAALSIYGYICLFKLVFWVSSDKYPEVEFLGRLSLVVAFVLKPILSGISIATPAFCCCCFRSYEIQVFPVPLLSACVCLSI